MWLQAAGALLGGIGAGGREKKAAERNFKYDWRLQEGQGRIGRQNMKFEYELQNYYKQLDKKNKARGLAEFRKFSTVQNFAPNYQNTNPEPVVPTMPVPNAGEYEEQGP